MLKKVLGITLTMLLCLPTSVVFANSNVNSSSKEITNFTKITNNTTLENNDYEKSLNNTKVITENKSDGLLESEKIVDTNIKKDTSIKTNINQALLSSLQKSIEPKPYLTMNKSITATETTTSSAADVSTSKPIAGLGYAILNPSS